MRRCLKCGVSKPWAEFSRWSRDPAGFQWWCRDCKRVYRKEYYAHHRSIENVRSRNYKQMHRDRIRVQRQKYHALKSVDPEYRQRAVARMNEWQRQHPEAVYLRKVLRRARKHQVGGAYTMADVRRMFIAQDGKCFYCTAPLVRWEVDHKTPLVRGGSNGPENLCLCCRWCNARKGKKTAQEFLVSI